LDKFDIQIDNQQIYY